MTQEKDKGAVAAFQAGLGRIIDDVARRGGIVYREMAERIHAREQAACDAEAESLIREALDR